VAVEEFLAPTPPLLRETIERLRAADETGHRIHDPGARQLAMGLAVGVTDANVVPLDVEPEQGEGGFRQSDWMRHGFLLDTDCGIVPRWRNPQEVEPIGAAQPLSHRRRSL